jgi:hypothetical protein
MGDESLMTQSPTSDRTPPALDPDEFFNAPALSFGRQPAIADLFDLVARRDEPVTFVLGAGLSLDAGLPTWENLLVNIADLIGIARWRTGVLRDDSQPTRKAEYALQLALEERSETSDELIRAALYKGGYEREPGPLTDRVARLIVALGSRARVITTNYDTLIERALARYYGGVRPVSYALQQEEVTAWRAQMTGQPPPVMHVHGLLECNKTPRGPVVLTESTFLRYGAQVQELIREQLLESHLIFIGVSMSDPNLVGPLWEVRDHPDDYASDPKAAFVFIVADAGNDDSIGDDQRRYVVKRAGYLADTLNVRTIFSKSYGQQIQLVADLALAREEPQRYLDDDGDLSCLRYGKRFVAALDSCYESLGCSTGTDMAAGEAAAALSEQLHARLAEEADGPANIARRFIESLEDDSTKVEHYDVESVEDLRNERFGYFLWLRARPRDRSEYRPYELRLIGSSVYTHRDGWSLDRQAPIVSYARHAAAQAAFFGRTHMTNLYDTRAWQLWRSTLAVPFTVPSGRFADGGGASSELDAVSVGVITLNSTHYLLRDADGEYVAPRSTLSYLHQRDELRRLTEEMSRTAQILCGN